MSQARWLKLNREIVACQQCRRLTKHCQTIAQTKRKAYAAETYWGRPVPNLGSHQSDLLIVGLAPGAHGANRTGRMFTGDRSGDWLFRAMHQFGFCNQPESSGSDDGLVLHNCAITNACHCAPPDNKPTTTEIKNCQPFFERTIELCQPRGFIALGGLAWTQTVRQLIAMEWLPTIRPAPKFGHATTITMPEGRWLIGSYHPSQQNTFTGRLTEAMLEDVFRAARERVG